MENCFGLSHVFLLLLLLLLVSDKHFSENMERDAYQRPGSTKHCVTQINFNGTTNKSAGDIFIKEHRHKLTSEPHCALLAGPHF